MKQIYRAEPHPVASQPRGEANAQPSAGAEIDWSAGREGTDTCGRPTMAGNFVQAVLTATLSSAAFRALRH